MARTIDQQLAELEAKRARLMIRKRKQDTRQKIIVGSIILAEAQYSPMAARKLLAMIESKVTRVGDKLVMTPIIEALEKVAGNE